MREHPIDTHHFARFSPPPLSLPLPHLVPLAANNLHNTVYLSTGTSLLHYRHRSRSVFLVVPPHAARGKARAVAEHTCSLRSPGAVGRPGKTRETRRRLIKKRSRRSFVLFCPRHEGAEIIYRRVFVQETRDTSNYPTDNVICGGLESIFVHGRDIVDCFERNFVSLHGSVYRITMICHDQIFLSQHNFRFVDCILSLSLSLVPEMMRFNFNVK